MADQIMALEAANTTPNPPSNPGHPQERLSVEEPNTTDDVVYPTGAQLWITTGSIILSLFLVGLDLTIVAPCVPSLSNDFHTISDIGWYSSTYGFVLATFGFFFGKVYTVYSVKHVFIASLVFFELGSLLCTVAPTSKAFIVGRAISGFGSSSLQLGAFTIVAQCFALQKRPTWIGIAGAAQGIGLVTAPVLGGALIDAISWRACFGINLPLGVVVIALVAYFFTDPTDNEDLGLPFKEKIKRLDILSTLIFVPAIACLLLALQMGGITYPWSNYRVILLLVASVTLLAVFAYLQHRHADSAILPPRIIKNRSILASAWFSICCNGALAVTEFYIAIYFQGVKGYSATKSGLLGLPMIVGLLVASVAAGFGTSLVGYYAPFMLATAVIAPIASGVLTTLNVEESELKVLLCLGALGFAIGLGTGSPTSAINTVLPAKEVSMGMAVLAFGGGMGGALFLAVSAALLQKRLVDEVEHYAPLANTTRIEDIGLSDIRKVIGGERLKDVLLGYDKAVTQTLYLPVALLVLSFIGPTVVEWRSVKKKQS